MMCLYFVVNILFTRRIIGYPTEELKRIMPYWMFQDQRLAMTNSAAIYLINKNLP